METIDGISRNDVCVVGMGFVGLTLAATLALENVHVVGYEVNNEVCRMLNRGEVHFYEKGLSEAIKVRLGRGLTFTDTLPSTLPPIVIVCVGTPVNDDTHEPDYRQLESALRAITEHLTSETLVIVRSTVAVGTSRNVVLPHLLQKVTEPQLAFCPERTIQGKALEELRSLPQIISGLNEQSVARARALFDTIAHQTIVVSSLETAEMIKLICNSHTDLIYGFGNQVALMADVFGLDAYELINSANLNYPRPDLARPGFVGGSCLSKDPYLLMYALAKHDYFPPMIAASRQLNESVPLAMIKRAHAALQKLGKDLSQSKIFISGFAYKGQPETSDMRGSAVTPILEYLQGRVHRIVGHDFIVTPDRISALQVEAVSLEEGFKNADIVMLLNDHPHYKEIAIQELVATMHRPAVVFDAWGIVAPKLNIVPSDIQYMRLSWMNAY